MAPAYAPDKFGSRVCPTRATHVERVRPTIRLRGWSVNVSYPDVIRKQRLETGGRVCVGCVIGLHRRKDSWRVVCVCTGIELRPRWGIRDDDFDVWISAQQ